MDTWTKVADALTKIVDALGPLGAVVIAGLVGLGIALVIFAHTHGLYGERRAGTQSLEFVDRLLAAVDRLAEREAELRADLERSERESQSYHLRSIGLQADVDLMRVQLKRVIVVLRDVREGRLLPNQIRDADLADLAETIKS